jgi:hypothetical protein
MRKLLGLVVLGLTALTAACMDMEYGIALEEDLSGTSTLDLTIELERVAYVGALMQRMFKGEDGPPTDEEIAAVREELLDEWGESGKEIDAAEMRGEIEEDLPEGVTLLGVTYDRDGLTHRFHLALRFDNLASLNELQLEARPRETGESGEGAAAAGPGAAVPAGEMTPFEGLRVVEEDGTIVIRKEPFNPLEIDEGADAFAPDALFESMLQDFRIAFKVEAPFEIVEHNATRVDGATLYWEYDLADLEAGPEGVYVRYRR